ncbi:MAG TPA: hypothetical protein VGJ04_10010, partial [Pirellulales bacterium]
MTTDSSSPIASPGAFSPARPWPLWPAGAILALGAAAIAYFQIIGLTDNGTSNGFTFIAVFAILILLGLWTAFFSPFSRPARWWCIASAIALIALL